MNRIVVVGKCLEFDDIIVDRQLAQYIVGSSVMRSMMTIAAMEAIIETFHKIVDIAIFGMDKFVFSLLLEIRFG